MIFINMKDPYRLFREYISQSSIISEGRHKLDQDDAQMLQRGANRRLSPFNVEFTDHAFDRVVDRFKTDVGKTVDYWPILYSLDKIKEDPDKLERLKNYLDQGMNVAIVDKEDNVQIIVAPKGENSLSVITVGRFGDKFKNNVASGKSTKLVVEGEEIMFDKILKL